MSPEVATKEIKEVTTTDTEVTKNLSTWILEETYFGTTMGTQLMHQKWLTEFSLFTLQARRVTEVIEEEGLREEEEDLIEDPDQDEEQAEDLIKDINQNLVMEGV